MTARASAGKRPWDWRLARNHSFWDVDGEPTFHAHDVNDLAACSRGFGVLVSIEPVNEGSHLCPECMAYVRSHPAGRKTRGGAEKRRLAILDLFRTGAAK